MYSTACHRKKKRQSKHKTQAGQNQPAEVKKKKSQTLKLPYVASQSVKINEIWTAEVVPDDGHTGRRIQYIFDKYMIFVKV